MNFDFQIFLKRPDEVGNFQITMKQINLISLIVCMSIFLIACSDWPRDRIVISNKYYCIREERGFAFSSTVFDYEFYETRKWWLDKKLGNIVYRSEIPADSVQISDESQSELKRIIISKENKSILDTSLDFDKTFDINIGSKY